MALSTGVQHIKLTPRLRYRAVGEEGVLVHLDNGRVLVVNEVGLRIVELLDKPMSRSNLATLIAEEFEVSIDQADSDLQQFLSDLNVEQVLEFEEVGPP